jgi:hypothetical protein
MADEAREHVALAREPTDTTAAILQACALEVNAEISNEAFASEIMGIALLSNSAAQCEQKNSPLLEPGSYRWIGFSKDDQSGSKAECDLPPVGDNPFHQLELSALFRFR